MKAMTISIKGSSGFTVLAPVAQTLFCNACVIIACTIYKIMNMRNPIISQTPSPIAHFANTCHHEL